MPSYDYGSLLTPRRNTPDLLDDLTQQELCVISLYLQVGKVNKYEFYEHADRIRALRRRDLLVEILDTPADDIAEVAVHVIANSLHSHRIWPKRRKAGRLR